MKDVFDMQVTAIKNLRMLWEKNLQVYHLHNERLDVKGTKQEWKRKPV